ncbi:hypothetical protein GCM10022214_77580 [Actinomadura miaoliensis]|uniref:Uncharacterized protein n=1 Tax=Actinomadura miaoliensis TaxID=430685 RepID=A0ABP7X1V4_9ACTN
MCPGDVRLIAAPDAPFGAVCLSATRHLFGPSVVSVPRTRLPDTVTSRCQPFQRYYGRGGTGDDARTAPTIIWLCPENADRGPIVIRGARLGAPAGPHHRVAWPTAGLHPLPGKDP